MLWVRNIKDRLEKLAPFLSYDGDPYPVAMDGQVYWIVDGYTQTSRYPYAQRIGNDVQLTTGSGLDRDANYVRNSVKAVVDAYDGSVTFYVQRRGGPDHQGVGGRLRQPVHAAAIEMPEELRRAPALPRGPVPGADRHLLQVPARLAAVLRARGAWSVAQAPSIDPRESTTPASPSATTPTDQQAPADLASESSTARFTPYYTMFADPSGDGEDFVILRPFVPFSTRRPAHRAAGVHDGLERS